MDKKILKIVAYTAIIAVIGLSILTIRRLYNGYYPSSSQNINSTQDR